MEDKQIFKSKADTYNNAGKLGLQVACNYPNQDEFEALMTQRPAVIKLMDDFSCAGRIKEISPSTIVVGRMYDGNFDDRPGDQLLPDDNVGSRVNDWFNSKGGIVSGNPSVDCWEGPNEPGIFSDTIMSRYAQFEAQRAQGLAEMGSSACIGNFSVGTPGDMGLWPYFYDALGAIQSYGGFLALHEYSAPDMRCMYDEGSGDGWLTGRYRKVYNNYLIPDGFEVPLLITETGMTRATCGSCGCADGGTSDTGWRTITDANTFTNDLQWYNSVLEGDGYVYGAAIFISGYSSWSTFDLFPDIVGPSGLLINYGGGNPAPTSMPTSTPNPGYPTETPVPGQPTATPNPRATGQPTSTPTPSRRPTASPTPTIKFTPTPTPRPTVPPITYPTYPKTSPTSSTSKVTPTKVPKLSTSTSTSSAANASINRYDFNGDKVTNSMDVALFVEVWRGDYEDDRNKYDLNNDEVLNSMDYAQVIAHLNR